MENTRTLNDSHISSAALSLDRARGEFSVDDATIPAAGAGEIVIEVRAVAMNIFDHLIRSVGHLVTPWLDYPAVLGTDVAGVVVRIGEGVTRFAAGDRVVGLAAGTTKERNRADEGAFRSHCVLLEHMTSPLGEVVSFADAAAIPLAVSTAACGLFQRDFLALDPPAADRADRREVLLVWGASTSVGAQAVLLARAAGYRVFATAGQASFDTVRKLGAEEIFDYADRATPARLKQALEGRIVAGALAVGPGSSSACIDILSKCSGKRFVALATTPASFEDVPVCRGHWRALVPVIGRMLLSNLRLALSAKTNGVETKFIWGTALIDNEVGPMIFADFLPQAIASGYLEALPPVTVVEGGLAAIPDALERRRSGVRNTKLVVTI